MPRSILICFILRLNRTLVACSIIPQPVMATVTIATAVYTVYSLKSGRREQLTVVHGNAWPSPNVYLCAVSDGGCKYGAQKRPETSILNGICVCDWRVSAKPGGGEVRSFRFCLTRVNVDSISPFRSLSDHPRSFMLYLDAHKDWVGAVQIDYITVCDANKMVRYQCLVRNLPDFALLSNQLNINRHTLPVITL